MPPHRLIDCLHLESKPTTTKSKTTIYIPPTNPATHFNCHPPSPLPPATRRNCNQYRNPIPIPQPNTAVKTTPTPPAAAALLLPHELHTTPVLYAPQSIPAPSASPSHRHCLPGLLPIVAVHAQSFQLISHPVSCTKILLEFGLHTLRQQLVDQVQVHHNL